MGNRNPPGRGITPPKGRPTRPRGVRYGNDRVFGPTFQWLAVIVLLVVAFVVMVILTGGGDFNPFNHDQTGSLVRLAAAGQMSGG